LLISSGVYGIGYGRILGSDASWRTEKVGGGCHILEDLEVVSGWET